VQEHHGRKVRDDLRELEGGFGAEEGDDTECREGLEIFMSFAIGMLEELMVIPIAYLQDKWQVSLLGTNTEVVEDNIPIFVLEFGALAFELLSSRDLG
jgi:hypothetical protein